MIKAKTTWTALAALLWACLLAVPGPAPAAAEMRLAIRVLPVRVGGTDSTDLFVGELFRELSNASGYSLFPRAGLKAVTERLVSQGLISADDDADDAQIAFGGSLKADRVLAVKIGNEGGSCSVSVAFYHVPDGKLMGRKDFESACATDELAGLVRYAGRELVTAGSAGSGAEEPEKRGNRFYEVEDAGLSLAFIRIIGGDFTMGSDEAGDDAPPHSVKVDNFYISTHEITRAQWEAVMGEGTAHVASCPTCPAESVNWNDIQAFLRKAGGTLGWKVRLPTEAEWEYAAAGGEAAQAYAGTSSTMDVRKYGWYSANAGDSTRPSGTKMPNRFGVYDMMGNVKEWCADRYGADYYGSSPAENPAGPRVGGERVVRGGGFQDDRVGLKVALRAHLAPNKKAKDLGFRVVLDTSRRVPVKESIALSLE